jgi:hypothetical protein
MSNTFNRQGRLSPDEIRQVALSADGAEPPVGFIGEVPAGGVGAQLTVANMTSLA